MGTHHARFDFRRHIDFRGMQRFSQQQPASAKSGFTGRAEF